MGYYKELEIERMEDSFMDVPSYSVGISLVGNQLLKEYIISEGESGVCKYSGRHETVIPFDSLLRKIHEIILDHYGDPDNEGVGWNSHFEDGGDCGFREEGGGYVVPDNRSFYTEIGSLLEKNGFVVNDAKLYSDIVENFPAIKLIEKDPYGLNETEERLIDWREISAKATEWMKASLEYPTLSVADRARLMNLLEAIQTFSRLLFSERNLELYRTVNYKEEKLPEPLFKDLTSPPLPYTKNLRMSPQGVSFFYGASTLELSRMEAVSHGDKVCIYTGVFTTKKPMLVLDLRRFRQRVTIFDIPVDYYYVASFLQHFAHQISKPVSDNTDDYCPTQFVTKFFRDCLFLHEDGNKSPIQGILYDSSKNPDEWDAVLFYDNEGSEAMLNLEGYYLIDQR